MDASELDGAVRRVAAAGQPAREVDVRMRVVSVPSLIVVTERMRAAVARDRARLEATLPPEALARLDAAEARAEREAFGLDAET